MKWTYEYREQIKEKVRSILVRKPNASQYELAKILEIDKDVAQRLKKQVIAENTRRISDQKIDAEVGKMEVEYEQLALECWQIITQETRKVKLIKDGQAVMVDGKPVEVEELIPLKDKLGAIRAIVEAKKTLFNIKFDAGIFSRKLGELEIGKTLTEEEKELIKKAIQMDYGKPTDKSKPEPKPAGDSTASPAAEKPSTTGGDSAGDTGKDK